MSLVELVDNTITDKNTVHAYLDLYEKLLYPQKETARNILEIGICSGGSIKLWYDYFKNATVYGLDIMHINDVNESIKNNSRIILHTSTDAYNTEFFNAKISDTKFDMVLDDGPHTLESMQLFITMYSQVLTDTGILILEDIQEWGWIEILKNYIPENLKQFVEVYDLREIKGRYDDIVLVINKNKSV
jgi:hypothetical protein